MTKTPGKPEAWQRGPVPQVPALLQPVAHALIQAAEEVSEIMDGFPESLLWRRPAGVASPAFHLMHLTGVLDRLFTYADDKPLSDEQFEALRKETAAEDKEVNVQSLVAAFQSKVDDCIKKLKETDESSLGMPREIGRKKLPTTVGGLLFHAAEHTMRHVGQLLVTAQVVRHRYNLSL